MFTLYSLLLAFAFLLSLPWWALQLLLRRKYRAGVAERLGFVPPRLRPQIKPGCIWIHAVSVGEVLAISRLVQELKTAFPHRPVFVSTTTATGQTLARERFGDTQVFYMPIDLGFPVRAYLDLLQPGLLILAETEFWPNLLHLSRASGAAVAIVNARISDRSFPRYQRFRWFFVKVLADVDVFLAQTDEDAKRLKAIGAPPDRIQVSGNLKFDISNGTSSPLQQQLRGAIPPGVSVIVCGSTTPGEEEVLLAALSEILNREPSTLMVLAPRHPDRFDAVEKLVISQGLPLVRRSSWKDSPLQRGIFLLDTIGELASVYALADVAFVGGSLFPNVGGHNILEPAQHGVPILVGPNTFNFREIVKIFEEGKALVIVNEFKLTEQLLSLLHDAAARQELGQRARELFLANSGSTARTLVAIEILLRPQPLKIT